MHAWFNCKQHSNTEGEKVKEGRGGESTTRGGGDDNERLKTTKVSIIYVGDVLNSTSDHCMLERNVSMQLKEKNFRFWCTLKKGRKKS